MGKAGANPTAIVRPDPEVVAKAKRRKFTAKYKQQILAKADAAASKPGAIGALLGHERLHSSHLVKSRRDREPAFDTDLRSESVAEICTKSFG